MAGNTLDTYLTQYESLLNHGLFTKPQVEKQKKLTALMHTLHVHHQQQCLPYRKLFPNELGPLTNYADFPYLAVRLFKVMQLQSIADHEIFRTLLSSGTTGQTPAKVVLDSLTSARQSKALVKIMQEFIGKARLPMLIVDSPQVLKNPAFSARAAGVQGMAFFGRKPVYALREDMSLDVEAVKAFAEDNVGQPVLIFGFTFMVWLHFVQALEDRVIRLPLEQGIVIHSGGWKKLADKQVNNATFKAGLKATCGIAKVHNFYGMAEQVGSVFVECEKGHLHAPSVADIVIRNPYTLAESACGEEGLIQVISALPTSYPGYSILTEDLGRMLGEDNCLCGRLGRHFEVTRRLPKTEIRGCSDTGSRE
ncbi:acyl-protein synthetase [Alteromonas pelagimontana]|uniref:Acyl-protein synthetase n=1 Tax=Alteromonas pelagimontana TaxID=1858656 RepID=A0A6M4MFA1_9ALTE|nr:acyl-protein synthetase [Alteromonas pelagimontana]QJR81834.1 acyl-protein synthetase [Alteromonas pelagimontana]